MAKMNMDMILNLKDKASKTLEKFNKNLDKTKAKLKETAKISADVGSGGGKGGDEGIGGIGSGVLTAGAIGATNAIGVLTTVFLKMGSALNLIAGHVLHVSTVLAVMIEEMKKGISASGALVKNSEELGDAFDMAAENADLYDTELRKVNKSIRQNTKDTEKDTKAQSKLGRTFGWLKGKLSVIGAAFASVAAMLTPIFQVGRRFEKLRATLSSVIPVTDNINDAFAFLQEVASKIPNTLEQTTTAFIRMNSLGLSPTEDSMISFANTASAMGKDILQFVEAVADASVGEFERLKEFGIKAKSQGEEVTFTFQGMSTTVGKNAADITRYLQSIGNESEAFGKLGTFAGAAAKQMDTLDGKMSNLGDNFNNTADMIYRAGLDQVFKDIIDGLSELVVWFGTAYIKAREWAAITIGAIDKVITYAKWFGQAIATMWSDNTLASLYKEREKELKAIDEVVEGMIKDLRTMNSNSDAGKRYAKVLEQRANATNANAKAQGKLNEVLVKGGHQLQSLSDFMADLSNETADEINRTNNLWAAQEKLDQWFQQGLISGEEYTLMLAKLNEQLGVTTDENEQAAEEINGFWQRAASNMQDAMGDTFFDWMQGKTTDMVGDFKKMIDRMVAEMLASKLMNFMVGNFATSGTLGGLFGNIFKAEGGPVNAGQSYIVGEQGPEIFTPPTSGTIIPNQKAAGGALTVNITAMDSADVLRSMEKIKRPLAEMMSGTSSMYNLT